ncbi:uncharacterized protein PAC_14786 [Phialocephala subalpina]|uniref:Uncharacterized protein n=1 Tax=Phialocephala subalpina TaxID=576137 RepID=A0A1L7XIV7_9HELO|nr:uncharacterized protein PAC_14786 [Phialocephala subalpina]
MVPSLARDHRDSTSVQIPMNASAGISSTSLDIAQAASFQMAESSGTSTSSPVIDYKKASSEDVKKALVRVTNQKKWGNTDSWRFYLKGRNYLFNDISRSPGFWALDWRNPDSWDRIEQEYIRRSTAEAKEVAREGEIPQWALDGDWMHRHPELVQWMRKEHWRNNKKTLIALFEQEAHEGGLGAARAEDRRARDPVSSSADGDTDAAGVGTWQQVVLR